LSTDISWKDIFPVFHEQNKTKNNSTLNIK